MRIELEKLREEMKKENISMYFIPMDDFHQSEYVGAYFRNLRFVSGFTGSAANLVVRHDSAKLFTDGRYFVQAERQLEGSGIDLMKMGEAGVPSLDAYIFDAACEGETFAFDGRVVDYDHGMSLEEALIEKNVSVRTDLDLVNRIWDDRPDMPVSKVWILDEKWVGKSAEKKLMDLREELSEFGANTHIITSLDDIAWLLNLRGDDVPCNPVFLSYLIVDMEKAYLFANEKDFDEETIAYLESLGVMLCPYNDVYKAVSEIEDGAVLLEASKTNYEIISRIPEDIEIIDAFLPTSEMKAVKNETEISNEKLAHIKDGVAITEYFYFMKHAFDENGNVLDEAKKILGDERLTEMSASAYLDSLRMDIDTCLDLSFPTISAYAENAALPHYSATEETDKEIKNRGLYLVDSGGQYMEGTTDITRTFAMGEITDRERRDFTLVAMAMLRLGNAIFLEGTSGLVLDYPAREVFWKRGLDFKHGTGHGVGYLLNVHERPNTIKYRTGVDDVSKLVFKEGHITSDEPGLYIEGSHGIRTENLTVCKKAFENEYGEFLTFEYLTLCPIDLDAIDTEIMTDEDRRYLNEYHEKVYKELSPYFEGHKKEWLRYVTRAI